jgi:hypothetical protein
MVERTKKKETERRGETRRISEELMQRMIGIYRDFKMKNERKGSSWGSFFVFANKTLSRRFS